MAGVISDIDHKEDFQMAKMGKRYVESSKLIDSTKAYEPMEALKLVQETAKAKFDETVEIHIRLGVESSSFGPAGSWSSCASKRNWKDEDRFGVRKGR